MPTPTLAYSLKEREGFGLAALWNTRIQRDRDYVRCACGHPNVAHGHGAESGPTWPDGSRIGRGGCGIHFCPCATFSDPDAPAYQTTTESENAR